MPRGPWMNRQHHCILLVSVVLKPRENCEAQLESPLPLEPFSSLILALGFLATLGGLWHYYFKNKVLGYRIASSIVILVVFVVLWLATPETHARWRAFFRLLTILYPLMAILLALFRSGVYWAEKKSRSTIKQLEQALNDYKMQNHDLEVTLKDLQQNDKDVAPFRNMVRNLREGR